MIEDLHVHSTMSDGSDTFEQVLEQAAQRGVERLAFTNHDTTAGLTAARELGERLGVQVVGGIEVSAYDFERGRKVHILGLGVEEGAPALAALCGPIYSVATALVTGLLMSITHPTNLVYIGNYLAVGLFSGLFAY